MEALVILLAEFIAPALLAAMVCVLEAMLGIVQLLFELGSLVLGRRRDAGPAASLAESSQAATADRSAQAPTIEGVTQVPEPKWVTQPRRAASGVRRWMRRAAVASLIVLACSLLVLLLLNTLYFEATMRWVLRRVERKSDIVVAFHRAEGNLWSGQVTLDQVQLQRTGHPLSNFELTARRALIDVSVRGLLVGQGVFDRVELRQLNGWYQREHSAGRTRAPRRFEVKHLSIRESDLQIRSAGPGGVNTQLHLEVDSWVAEPLRSNWAIFDILFRSNSRGRIEGVAYTISTQTVPGGRQTRWNADRIPVTPLAPYLGAPLTWLTDGTLDVDLVDRWSLERKAQIDMRCKFVLRNLTAKAPAGMSAPMRMIVKPAVAYLNDHAEHLPLEFDLVLDGNRFEGHLSPEAAGLGSVLSNGLLKELGEVSGFQQERLRRQGEGALDKFKDFLRERSGEQ